MTSESRKILVAENESKKIKNTREKYVRLCTQTMFFYMHKCEKQPIRFSLLYTRV